MAEKLSKILPKLLSSTAATDGHHKCGQMDCNRRGDQLAIINKLVVFTTHLNHYYIQRLKTLTDQSDDNRRQLMADIETQTETIRQQICQMITADDNNNNRKDRSTKTVSSTVKIKCDFCGKSYSSKHLVRHLTTHLDLNSDLKISMDFKPPDSVLSEAFVEVYTTSDDPMAANRLLLDADCEVKGEPMDDQSDAGSNWLADDNDAAIYSSDSMNSAGNDDSDDKDFVTQSTSTQSKSRQKSNKNTKKQSVRSVASAGRAKNGQLIDKNSDSDGYCDECQKTFMGKKALAIHRSRRHKTSINTNKIEDKEAVKEHVRDGHTIKLIRDEDFTCQWPDCGRKFRREKAMKLHYETHNIEQLKCTWPGCERQFRKQYQLDDHMTIHTGEKPYACEWPGCDMKFRQQVVLRYHKYTHMPNVQRKHVCYYPECDKSFDRPVYLKHHIYSVHKRDEKPHKCSHDGCTSRFVSPGNLRLHLKTVHMPDEERIRYRCSIEGCNKAYADDKKRLRHEQTDPHLPKEPKVKVKRKPKPPKQPRKRPAKRTDKPHECDWPGCDYKANHPAQVKVHKMRVHTGEKPKVCSWPGCTFRAVRVCEIKTHMFKHTGEAPYPCEMANCGRRFKSQRALDTHWEKSHQHL